jgi:CRP-like cAMP-binding protein
MFAPEGWIISDLESHEFDQPAELFIECLEDCELTVIKRTNLNFAILNDEEKIKHLQLMHRRISVMQRRIIMQMSYSAKQRYEFFLNHYPNLLNRLSSKIIASFLGMTPETLSSLRSSMAKK